MAAPIAPLRQARPRLSLTITAIFVPRRSAISRRSRSALASGNLLGYRISDPKIMGYLRNNSMFAYGRSDRAKTSANYREIMDAMWLFNEKFDRALAEYEKVKPR